MTETPLVSIHVISYNQVEYIERALNSLVQQETDFDYEIVIGDDCSTDGTTEIVADFHRRYPDLIRVVASAENVGMPENSHRVMMACRGTYVAFCEGDDFFHNKKKLQRQVQVMEQNESCGLVHSDHDRYFEEYDTLVPSFFKTTNNMPTEGFNIFRGWNGLHILTCTVMAKTELVKKIMQDERVYLNDEHKAGTDIPMFIELSMCSEVVYVDDSLSTYTVRVESASNTRSVQKRIIFSSSSMSCFLYLSKKYGMDDEVAYFSIAETEQQMAEAMWNNDRAWAKELSSRVMTKKAKVFYLGARSLPVRFAIKVYMNIKAMTNRRLRRKRVSNWARGTQVPVGS